MPPILINTRNVPDPFTTYVLLEDFEYFSSPGLVDKYVLISGNVDAPGSFSQDYGTMEVQALLSAGNFGALQNENGSVKPGDKWTIKQRATFVNELNNSMGILGMESINGLGDATTIAGIEVFIEHGALFTFDPARSANWFSATYNAGTKTETDTGVAPAFNVYQDFEIIHTPGDNTVFKINGSTVATHFTNLPSALLAILSSVWNKNGVNSKNLEVDFWVIESGRS